MSNQDQPHLRGNSKFMDGPGLTALRRSSFTYGTQAQTYLSYVGLASLYYAACSAACGISFPALRGNGFSAVRGISFPALRRSSFTCDAGAAFPSVSRSKRAQTHHILRTARLSSYLPKDNDQPVARYELRLSSMQSCFSW